MAVPRLDQFVCGAVKSSFVLSHNEWLPQQKDFEFVWEKQFWYWVTCMGLLPDAWNYGLRMHRECRELFARLRLKMKPLISDPSMHHGTWVTAIWHEAHGLLVIAAKHVPWCMSGSLIRGVGENVPGIPGAYATRNFTYLARGPLVVM